MRTYAQARASVRGSDRPSVRPSVRPPVITATAPRPTTPQS